MTQKKVCMVGAFAVGKTSLVQQYVHSIFSDKYLTTVGVKIDKKVVVADGREVNLVIWDIQGEDEYQKTRVSYLRGASGLLLVADGTRTATLDVAMEIADGISSHHPGAARILLLNKADLTEAWAVQPASTAALTAQGWTVLRTSAKTGEGVEEAFVWLTRLMLERH